MAIRKVTVGVDGSPASRNAVDWAVERSRTSPCTLELVTVVPESRVDSDFAATVRRYYEANLAECIASAKESAPGLAVAPAIRTGSPAAELVAASEETDLLVVGTDKTSRARQLVYGTVPLRLAALTACPLVVVPRTWRGGMQGRIVLAVGDERPYETATEFATAEAEARQLPLDLVHVWAAAPNYPSPLYLTDYPWELLEQAGQQLLDDAVRDIRAAHPTLTLAGHLKEGPTIPRLIEAAADAQLLVVGRGGRGIFRDLLQLGSVAHDVLLNPPVPVAVIPAQRAAASSGKHVSATTADAR